MTFTGPGRAIRERGDEPPAPPPRVNPMPLSDLPDIATVREAAARMTYEEACRVAGSILDDVKAGKITKPYSAGQRMALRVCAAVFSRESGQ